VNRWLALALALFGGALAAWFGAMGAFAIFYGVLWIFVFGDSPWPQWVDAALPVLLQNRPDVLAITADHSTPCPMKGHSWHPPPILLNSAFSGSDKLDRFTETGSNLGSLGVFESKYLIRQMQANARMFDKFGA